MKNLTYLTLCLYGLLILGCTTSTQLGDTVNKDGSLPSKFNFPVKNFKVMSLLINKNEGTMSTLYGNDIAIDAAINGTQKQAPGMKLCLITWKQKANLYWYGNNIPGELLTIETLSSDENTSGISYARYAGKSISPLANVTNADQRIKYILYQKPSVMP
jgi:hypothetical protein